MKTLKEIFDLNRLSTILLYTSIISFIIAFNFSDNPPVSGWQQQFMPNFNGKPLKDITFTDSLTGYALIGYDNSDSNFILKTTNSGDNWDVIRIENRQINKISFLNNDTGYVCGANPLTAYLIRTTNGGLNWSNVNTSATGWEITNMFVLNTDTIWTCETEIDYYIRRTTNGGNSWTQQFTQTSSLNNIYMYNGRIGFMCESSKLLKTTNSGDNWILQPGQKAFLDIYFADSLLGWKKNSADLINDTLVKTTNGGLNWFNIDVPRRGAIYGGNLASSASMTYFTNINKDTIWGAGGVIRYPGNIYKGILFKSNNGGQNWLIQIPDTGFRLPQYYYIDFINRNIGWNYTYDLYKGIHSTSGGDSTFFTSIDEIVLNQPDNFILKQNYPNPFNPNTVISYELQVTSFVKLKVFTVQGKEIKTLVNQRQNAGKYNLVFEGSGYTSGIYFYSLFLNGKLEDTKKMIYLK
ncbi:MAG: T9SS type A sorting domain-containing protein [Ignavibacteria bacterium]|nr:T9SS type A sorting domain-containing protein [Ignavibacteria bacterium]